MKDKKKIVKAIKDIIESLDSHLEYAVHTDVCPNKDCPHNETVGDKRFHKNTILNYIEDIKTLAEHL